MSSKKKTTETSTSTVTPNNPQWVTDSTQNLTGLIGDLSNRDPTSFVAGETGLTSLLNSLSGGLGQTGASQLGQAGDIASGVAGNPVQASLANASTAAQNMGQYYNPYQQQVVDSTISSLDRARQLAQNTNGQSAILAGQYGGSRQGVVDANTNRDFAEQVANTVGNLNYQGFNTAAQLGNSDADRQTGTSQFNAGAQNSVNLANQQAALQAAGLLGNLGQAGIGALGDAASTQQGIAQSQAQAPLSVLQALSGAYGSLPLGLFQGQTQTGSGTTTSSTSGLGSVLGSIGGLALGIGGLGSGLGAGGLGLFGSKG